MPARAAVDLEARREAVRKRRGLAALRSTKRQKRSLKTTCVTDEGVCYLCPETRLLEKAHVIPLSLWADMDAKTKVPEPFLYVMMLCPTHHRCYDNYMLTEKELAKVRFITRAETRFAFESLLWASHANPETDEKTVNNFLRTSWNWWRNYYACA